MILFFRCTHWIVREIQVYNRSIKQTYYNILVWQPLVCCADNTFFLWWLLSIPIDTITIVGWTSINPSYDLMWTEGVPGFWPIPHLQFGGQRLCSLGGGVVPLPWWPFCVANCNEKKRFRTKNIRIDGWCYYPNQHILFISGEFWFVMKIKFMLLPQSTYCSEGVTIFDP